jgi:hypothetical protein
MSSGIKRCAFGRRVRYHTMSVFRFALAETDSQAAKLAKRVRTEIAPGGQSRTSVPQLPLRRNVSPPGRGPLHMQCIRRPGASASAVPLLPLPPAACPLPLPSSQFAVA